MVIDPLKKFDDFVLDCDGVLYRGDIAIDGAKECIERLYSEGKNVKFLTNYPFSRAKVCDKLKDIVGVEVPEEDVMTVAYATAKYMELNSSDDRTVYVFGIDDLYREIRKSGFKIMETDEILEGHKLVETPEWLVISLYEAPDFYRRLTAAGLILRSSEFNDEHYLATSKGKGWTREDGISPGIGCTIAALETFSGKKPIVIGKPSNIFTDMAFSVWNINPQKAVMIGDKWSDIEVANKYGMYGIKVETGKQDFFESIYLLNKNKKPSMVLKSINGLFNENEIIYLKEGQ